MKEKKDSDDTNGEWIRALVCENLYVEIALTMHAFFFLLSNFKRSPPKHATMEETGQNIKAKNRFLFLLVTTAAATMEETGQNIKLRIAFFSFWSPLRPPPLKRNYLQTSRPPQSLSMLLNIFPLPNLLLAAAGLSYSEHNLSIQLKKFKGSIQPPEWFMDIDPFWVTGGCFIITDFNFMATARNLSVCENTTKLQAMVLFLGLLFIVPLLARPIDLSKKFTASSPFTRAKHSATEIHPQESKYKPPSRTTADAAAMTSSGTTTTVSATPGSASNQQFKAAFHEVPSGPNPESN
ncbi:hypothetical protein SADUNF_Sadunf03G0137800 [Salix dunnii]|uniref:Uncharacterized protein n=1 Tax=Salix dunnii TaxID=1413687 RepID=A0A835TGL5_9ROSI|nr:hypothetical protein SADUNF_Sadunf03G0137800 [Salix dunnii]